jgi:hypothetical protein
MSTDDTPETSPDDATDTNPEAAGASAKDSPGTEAAATRVAISYPADLSSWGRHQIEQRHFRAYLRKSHDRVEEGDDFEEFVGVGCCGNTLDVPLVVERVEGGSRMGPDTDIEYEEREFCGIDGSWRVQSAGGPKNADNRAE